MDSVDAFIVALPGWGSRGALGHPGSRWVLDADAQLLDVGHGIVVNVGVPDVVVALA